MVKTKYTVGFEQFWKVWTTITRNFNGKYVSFKYWKRDKLEGDTDELIRRLRLQQAKRKMLKKRGEWQPQWCFCQKWLNRRRYEYVPELPRERKTKIRILTVEEKKQYEEKYNTPESRAAKAKYLKLQEKLFG